MYRMISEFPFIVPLNSQFLHDFRKYFFIYVSLLLDFTLIFKRSLWGFNICLCYDSCKMWYSRGPQLLHHEPCCWEPGHTARGEQQASDQLHLHLQPLSMACITAWALPLVRSVAPLDSHRSVNPNLKFKKKFWDCHKIKIKCTINVICLYHPEIIPTTPPWSLEKLSSSNSVPGAKKVGDCCDKGFHPFSDLKLKWKLQRQLTE